MALMYDRGAGVFRQPERAASLKRRACELGHGPACPAPARTS
jgi:TPR repeat protein